MAGAEGVRRRIHKHAGKRSSHGKMRVQTKFSCVIDKTQAASAEAAVACWVAEGRVTAAFQTPSSTPAIRSALDWRALLDCAVLRSVFPEELMSQLACVAVCGTRLSSLAAQAAAWPATGGADPRPARTRSELLFMVSRRENRGSLGSRREGAPGSPAQVVGRLLLGAGETDRGGEADQTLVGLEWVARGQRSRVFLRYGKMAGAQTPTAKSFELALLYGAAGTISVPSGQTGIWCVAANHVADRRLASVADFDANPIAADGSSGKYDPAEYMEVDLTESRSTADWPAHSTS